MKRSNIHLMDILEDERREGEAQDEREVIFEEPMIKN